MVKTAPPIYDTPRPSPGKKNTRKWCKGIVGREHDFERLHWCDLPNAPSFVKDKAYMREGYAANWFYDCCRLCGKQVMA